MHLPRSHRPHRPHPLSALGRFIAPTDAMPHTRERLLNNKDLQPGCGLRRLLETMPELEDNRPGHSDR